MIYIDFEVRSELDLKKVGSFVYANHPSTEILCMAYAVDNDPVELWAPDHFESIAEILTPHDLICAHNLDFEWNILKFNLKIDLPLERFIDSAAVARHANLPGKLEELAAFFGMAKDMAGHAVMMKLCRPRKASKDNKDRFWTPVTKPEDFAALHAYCAQDVEVTRACLSRLPPMSAFESRVYRATFRANARGMPVDVASAIKLQAIAKHAKAALSEYIEVMYGFTLGQVADIAAYLKLNDVTKATLRDFLKLQPDNEVARARQTFAKSSTAKIDALLNFAQVDGRIHGGLVYGGAERTLRFSGRAFQAQNLVRGLGKLQDQAYTALDADMLEFMYKDILSTIAGMIRGLITDAFKIYWGDYSQIEARLLGWYAGDEVLLEIFRTGGDPYKVAASKIYHVPLAEVTPDQRFMGKQSVLACGYGLGRYGFQSLLDLTYDVQVSDDEAEAVVQGFRQNNPKIVAFWDRIGAVLELAFLNIGKRYKITPRTSDIDLTIKFSDAHTFDIRLPSGRKLNFYKVTRDKDGWECFSRLKDGSGYGQRRIYPGLICGVIVQSTARELIARSIVRLDEEGFPVILTVHDEAVAVGDGRFDLFKEIMLEKPDWLEDFPLGADVVQSTRYRK